MLAGALPNEFVERRGDDVIILKEGIDLDRVYHMLRRKGYLPEKLGSGQKGE